MHVISIALFRSTEVLYYNMPRLRSDTGGIKSLFIYLKIFNWRHRCFLCRVLSLYLHYRASNVEFGADRVQIMTTRRRFHSRNVRSFFIGANSSRTFSISLVLSPDQRTLFLMRPRPSISVSRTSPRCKYSGGLRVYPTPAGVPVRITSPGNRVINCEM